MLKVGLTGGYASGKSFVASELERHGCHVIYADRLGHAVLEPYGEAYRPTVEAFGTGILGSDGTINRKKLGAVVFHSPELLERLSGFVHPAVFRLEAKMLAEFEQADPGGIAVIEAAILIETGRYKVFDRLILTACSEEIQIARGMHRDGLTREQVLARLSKQMPLAEKRRFADYVVDTGGPKTETIKQVSKIVAELKALQEK